MTPNHVKQRIRNGQAAFGSLLNFGDPLVAEMMASVGFDWLLVDTEHGPIDMAALATIIILSVHEDETGAAAGVNNVARTLGGAVGGQLAAVLLVLSGYTAAFAIGLVATVGAIAVAPLIGGAHRGLSGTAATATAGRRSF